APRVIVSYPDLLAEPKRTMERIADSLGLSWPKSLQEAESSLNAFLDRSMRHRSPDSPAVRAEADGPVLEMAEAVYEEILKGAEPIRINGLQAEFAAIAVARRLASAISLILPDRFSPSADNFRQPDVPLKSGAGGMRRTPLILTGVQFPHM